MARYFQFHNHDLFVILNLLRQNSVQQDYFSELYPLPLIPQAVCPVLPKDNKIKWFWLIIAGSPPRYEGVWIGVLFIFQKMEEGIFFPPKGEVGKTVQEVCYTRVTSVCC